MSATLAPAGVELVELLELEAHQIDALGARGALVENRREPLVGGAPRVERAGDGGGVLGRLPRIEQAALLGGTGEGLVGVLAVHGDEPGAELAQGLGRDRVPVHARPGLAVRAHRAAQQALFVGVELAFAQPVERGGIDVERGRDLGARRAAAHLARRGARAEHEPERVEQDGFPGPGLAGERGHADPGFDLGVVDDREVGDVQVVQHGVSRRSVSVRAGVEERGVSRPT